MMKNAGVKEFSNWAVGAVDTSGEVVRWITVKALSRDDAHAQACRIYRHNDNIIGFCFEQETRK